MFAAGSTPEFLAAFDAGVDLLNGGFDVAAGERQAQSPVPGIVHPALVVSVVDECPV